MADEVRSRPAIPSDKMLSLLSAVRGHTRAHQGTRSQSDRQHTYPGTDTQAHTYKALLTCSQGHTSTVSTRGYPDLRDLHTHAPPPPRPHPSHSSHTHTLSEDRSREGLCLWTSLRCGKGEKCPRASLLPLLGQEVAPLTFWGLRPEMGGIHPVTSAQARVGWVGMGVETGPEKGQGQPGSVVEEVIGPGAKSRQE